MGGGCPQLFIGQPLGFACIKLSRCLTNIDSMTYHQPIPTFDPEVSWSMIMTGICRPFVALPHFLDYL